VTEPAAPLSRADISPAPDAAAGRLRRGLLAVAALGTLTTTVELAFLRHWTNALELIPWVSLALVASGLVPVWLRATRGRLLWARIVGVVTALVATIGVGVHVWQNYDAAPLDFRYTASWPTTPEPVRWLLAFTDTVGPTPSLAPLALAFISCCLILATLGHPALADRTRAD
jgi:hypothetical protein